MKQKQSVFRARFAAQKRSQVLNVPGALDDNTTGALQHKAQLFANHSSVIIVIERPLLVLLKEVSPQHVCAKRDVEIHSLVQPQQPRGVQ